MKFIAVLFFALILSNTQAEELNSKLLGTPWFLSCEPSKDTKKNNCLLERTIYLDGKNKTRLLTISIVSLKNKQGGTLRFLTPLETLLPFGLSLEVPGIMSAVKAPFLYCDLMGCYSQISLDGPQLMSMVNSKGIAVSYYYINNDNKELKLDIDIGNLKSQFLELQKNL